MAKKKKVTSKQKVKDGTFVITDESLWSQMDLLARQEHSIQREMEFMTLLKQAYDLDMNLIICCISDPVAGIARQGYMEANGKRLLLCYTSKERARKAKYNMGWDEVSARDIMNNMFNKDKIMGLVFNPGDKNMVIVFKDLLMAIMPGDKPKPEFYRE
ncbi:MAG: SseB family protein [Bulleidia sp.]